MYNYKLYVYVILLVRLFIVDLYVYGPFWAGLIFYYVKHICAYLQRKWQGLLPKTHIFEEAN